MHHSFIQRPGERKEAMNRRKIGTEYENLAARYLESKGLRILESNFRCRLGEIDLIAKDHSVIVFFEVKYRSSEAMGVPQEAVDHRKQTRICKVADYYRMTHHLGEFTPFRFDVISICDHHMIWIPNAFPYQSRK